MLVNKVKPLTPKQLAVLKFIEKYIQENEFAPSLEEISNHFAVSIPTIHQHVAEIKSKGHLFKDENQPRSLSILKETQGAVEVPIVGTIAAGTPIEAFEEPEPTYIPTTLIQSPNNHYALRVQGDSMIEDNIQDGDIVLIRHQSDASKNDAIVGLIDNKATLKRFGGIDENGRYILLPRNPKNEIIYVSPEDFEIRGKYLGLIHREKDAN